MHNSFRFSGSDFQTYRIAYSPKLAGRKVALEVGLEICAGDEWKSHL
jgi:hypothetical protein